MSKTYILLGRYGDILNLLPLLYQDFLKGERPRLMVAREFADLLEGCSYVETIIYEGPHHELDKAVAIAKASGDEVVVCQTNAPRDVVLAETYKVDAAKPSGGATSFAKESWRVAGRLHEWDNCWPLVIDHRSPEREAQLLADCLPRKAGRKKKLMLVSLDGTSSPFPYRQLLMLILNFACGKEYQILELPKAERIYDLLALYEKASVLIATDSAPLHLAWACRKLPVFALANDAPSLWHGSPWKPNHHWYCRYHDFPERVTEMVKALETLPECSSKADMVHVWSEYETTRKHESLGEAFPISIGMCGRDSKLVLQDSKRVPYLKDVIRMAMQKVEDETPTLLTRPDTEIITKQWSNSPLFAYRITRGETAKFSPICDWFMAPKSFWKSILPEIPDVFLCGDAMWSQALWSVFVAHGALDATGICQREETPAKTPVESKTRTHNFEIMSKTPMVSRYPAVSDQLETLPLDTRHVFFGGYNPTLLRTEQGFSMVYRFHKTGSNTALAIGEFDILGNFHDGKVLMQEPTKSLDDAKFFTLKGTPHISWVESNFPTDLKAVVKYAPIFGKGDIGNKSQDAFGKNDGTSTEKNWVYWENKSGDLHCLYECGVQQVIYRQEPDGWKPYISDGVKWAYGTPRGGTPPVIFDGNILRFFHSSLRNEFASGVPWRYYVGAYICQPFPPFKVLKVSKKPILYGSEVDKLSEELRDKGLPRKLNIVFPNGILEAKDSWVLGSGANDCSCVLSIIRPDDLNL